MTMRIEPNKTECAATIYVEVGLHELPKIIRAFLESYPAAARPDDDDYFTALRRALAIWDGEPAEWSQQDDYDEAKP